MTRSMRTLVAFVLFLPLLACAGRTAPERHHPLAGLTFEPLEFHVPEVERIELPNGVRLYLKEDHELPLVTVTAMVEAGSISAPAEKTGMTDLLASLLRTGGAGERSPEQVDEALERMAANLSVASDAYATSYDLSLQAQDLEGGMAILADMIRQPRFDTRRLEIARKQAIEGIRRQNDQPNAVASRALMRAIYGDHPLGRTPTEETVAAVGREDLVRFHREHFHPGNLWLAVSGDFDREQLMQAVERLFGSWVSEGKAPLRQIPPVESPAPAMVLVAPKDIPQTTILLGDLGIDKDDPDLHAVRVMNYILGGGGFNSRLVREIRSNRGLAYSVYSSFQIGRRLPGPFVAGTETKSDSTLEAVNLMRQIMAGMQREPVSENELNLAKESLINSFIFAFTNTHDVITQQMRLDFYDYPSDYLQTYREQVAAVTREDVMRAARTRLRPENANIVLVGDRSTFDGDPAALGHPVRQISPTGEFE